MPCKAMIRSINNIKALQGFSFVSLYVDFRVFDVVPLENG